MNTPITFGSVCSGIEAAQIAFSPLGFKQVWSSEIAEFPSKVLAHHYPHVPNIGNMLDLPHLIRQKRQPAPDIFCGGTPCQAFSLAGWKNGLADVRGQLTMAFIEIANAIDEIRTSNHQQPSIILWENVEGVLNDSTNAFGNFISGLAGFDQELQVPKWSKAGFIFGKTRNVAWRVLDAKYFGLPQQRKRLYVLAGGKEFRPDQLLFEFANHNVAAKLKTPSSTSLIDLFNAPQKTIFYKGEHKFEFFRSYTDCLYAAYGTKWNGNAAAYNGSLYIAQNDQIRRFIPLECERLMGLPDNYTLVNGNSDTNRYQAIGNSWAIPVINWIAQQISTQLKQNKTNIIDWSSLLKVHHNNLDAKLFLLPETTQLTMSNYLNTSPAPNTPKYGNLIDIVEPERVAQKFYLSPQACKGILRRHIERGTKMNTQLNKLMYQISNTTSLQEA
jgi:DNA (cytosine-5)-methyltransferase 1